MRIIITTMLATAALVACGADNTPAGSTSTAVTYKSCTEAQAAGKAPLHRGDPGYSTGLDRDGDGTACESATPTPVVAKRYATAEQLRDAAVEWGLPCDNWDGTGASDLSAAQSGVCTATVGGSTDMFAVYDTDADLRTDVAYLRDLALPGEDLNLLVGANWLISTDSVWAARLRAKLGGTIAK